MIDQYLSSLGISQLNEMQQATIKAAGKEKELILLSPTGSGKTLAFLLSLLPRLVKDQPGMQALIIAPSRELAIQIEQVARGMGSGFRVNSFYGGHSLRTELNNLGNPPAIAIGTPGRLLDLITKEAFDTKSIKHLILDEFDKSLEMGFGGEMSSILEHLTNLKTRFLTSATQAVKIPSFLKMSAPYTLDFTTRYENKESKLDQKMVVAEGNDKLDALFKLLCLLGSKKSLIFCNHREAVDRIGELLSVKGVEHRTYHGKLEQDAREKVLAQFRNGSVNFLLATDLAARGLDIAEIENVIHYQLPQTQEAFIHRNGRTARMNASGSSYLLLLQSEKPPKYLAKKPQLVTLPETLLTPPAPAWSTLEFSAGKKDKINKVDIVGLLFKKGLLEKGDIGLIDVTDKAAYAAVNREKAVKTAMKVSGEKIKKIKVRVSVL
ncbi:MAG: DEAD/DEAH box helicase [Imperialibacter sp.]|uniref:DEAD/DEAH box helicase n=1 Tax=Imperialibacter sp. TaxID=2038411 RepID=UPI0032ECE660